MSNTNQCRCPECNGPAMRLWEAELARPGDNSDNTIKGWSVACPECNRTFFVPKKRQVEKPPDLSQAIKRLEVVSARLRHCMMGKEWTKRNFDADIIDHEVLPVLKKAELELRELFGVDKPAVEIEIDESLPPDCVIMMAGEAGIAGLNVGGGSK